MVFEWNIYSDIIKGTILKYQGYVNFDVGLNGEIDTTVTIRYGLLLLVIYYISVDLFLEWNLPKLKTYTIIYY